jgi:hypothetical protein
MWPAQGGSGQLPYTARSPGKLKPELEEAFAVCGMRTEIRIHRGLHRPSAGRNTVMIGFDKPFYHVTERYPPALLLSFPLSFWDA